MPPRTKPHQAGQEISHVGDRQLWSLAEELREERQRRAALDALVESLRLALDRETVRADRAEAALAEYVREEET